MGKFEGTNYPSIFKYVGKKKTTFIIHYQADHKLYSETFRTISEARRALEDRRKMRDKGEIESFSGKKKTSFRRLVEKYMAVHEKNDFYKRSTQYSLSYVPKDAKNGEIRESPLVKYFGDMRLINITPEEIEKYKWARKGADKEWVKRKRERIEQTALKEGRKLTPEEVKEIENLPKGMSNAAVANDLGLLRHILNKAIEWNMLDRNPFSKFKNGILPKKNFRERFLTKDELNRLSSNSPKFLQDIIAIAVYTGLRKSDILSLKWSGIKIEERTFFYTEKKKGGKQGVKFMNDDLVEIFRGIESGDSEYLFPSDNKTHLKGFSRSWRRALKASGIKDCKFHDLRHTSVSHLAMKGVSLQAGQRHLGHSSAAMTERYTHLSEQFIKNEIQKLNGLIEIEKYKNNIKFDVKPSEYEIKSLASA